MAAALVVPMLETFFLVPFDELPRRQMFIFFVHPVSDVSSGGTCAGGGQEATLALVVLGQIWNVLRTPSLVFLLPPHWFRSATALSVHFTCQWQEGLYFNDNNNMLVNEMREEQL